MFQVIKRDGEEADFTLSKISDAIIKAFHATDVQYTNDVVDLLALRVTADFQSKVKDEGCLSIPGVYETVKRPTWIVVKYLDENLVEHQERVEGFAARMTLHEYDHLDGKMFIDHVSPIRKQLIKSKLGAILKGKVSTSYKSKGIK